MTFSMRSIRYRYPTSKPHEWDLQIDQIDLHPSEMVLIIGNSGAGKSTLLRIIHGLIPDFYGGHLDIGDISGSLSSGYVMQDPDSQMIMPDVESELLFGMEQHGLTSDVMSARLTHLNQWMDWSDRYHQAIETLSGGQKQRLLLSAISLLDPNVMIMDEPTAQLDEEAVTKLVDKVMAWKQTPGHSIIIADHRIRHWLPLSDRIVVMEQGRIIWQGPTEEWYSFAAAHETYRDWLPTPFNLFSTQTTGTFDLVKTFNNAFLAGDLVCNALSFQFKDASNSFFQNLSFRIPCGKLNALTGPNGSGKSTILKLISGLYLPSSGEIRITNGPDLTKWSAAERSCWIGYVSQNSYDHLLHDRVIDEFYYSFELIESTKSREELQTTIHQLADEFELSSRILHAHPRDLSSGERQRVALATVLLREPQLILLDEPSRGLSIRQKKKLIGWLLRFRAKGGTAFIVTHDMEFAALWADHVAIINHDHQFVWQSSVNGGIR